MRSHECPCLRRIASSLMLLAMTAFLYQAVMVSVSQAAAVVGFMPEPAVFLNGPVHFHDNLARHAHVHGDSEAGHVHGPADSDHHDDGGATHAPLWSLACTVAVIPTPGACVVSIDVRRVGEFPPSDCRDGIDPGGLT